MIAAWKRFMQEDAADIFDKGQKDPKADEQ
jgi:hypothetical protein